MISQRRISLFGRAELVIEWDADSGVGTYPGAVPYLEGMRNRLRREPAPLLEQVGGIMRRSFARNFAEGGRPAWPPLKPRTTGRKEALLRGGRIPRRTPLGKIPRRLLQLHKPTGERTFGGFTMLIETGRLRDSWCQKGARGNVSEIEGDSLFVGSQYTLERTLSPNKPLRRYHVLTKKTQRERAAGGSANVRIPLARIHEEGAPQANIPPRPVAHTADGGANVQPEDYEAIRAAQLAWVFEE